MMSERKPRVLGVDDSLTIRKALEIVLKPAGYELELAVDGADALAKAKSFKPDVILLDFILPDMRGSEVCQQLALDPETAHIPVILVSAKGAEIRQAYRDAHNVVSYIAKPFKPQVVTGIVAEVLAKTAAGEQVKAAVPVHEAEGLSIPPVAPVTPPPPPPPSWTSEQAPPPAASPSPVATPPQPVALPLAAEPLAPPARPAPRPRPAPRRPLPSLPLAEGMRVEAHSPFASEAARREALDLTFETLRSSTEGVYVEEVDTPLGAAADQAKSYIEILEALVRELGEGLEHARSGARYRLYGDGSVRSFDESLHEIFRRACRLVFRATSAGALGHDSTVQRPRVLVVCSKGGTVHRQLPALAAAHPDWQVFQVTEGFRQLPMVVRLFGPTVVLAEVTWSGALWEQLAVAARLPELQNARVIGVATAERTPPAALEDPRAREEALGVRAIRVTAQSLFEAEHILAEDRSPSEQEAMAEPVAAQADKFETAEPGPPVVEESLSAS